MKSVIMDESASSFDCSDFALLNESLRRLLMAVSSKDGVTCLLHAVFQQFFIVNVFEKNSSFTSGLNALKI
jgi:hypothetical protein